MKFVKLSLAACIAVCGIASSASAQDLEEAIKGVDVSGMLRYRYRDDRYTDRNYVKNNADKGAARHQWRAEALFKTPVMDAVSMNLSVRYHNPEQNVNHGNDFPGLGKGLGSGKDSSFGVGEFNAVITPDFTNTTVKVGKMILTTPLNDPLDDRGTGILAVNSDLEHWTFVGGAFDSWSIDDFQTGYVDPATGTNNGGSITKPLYTFAALANYETSAGNIEGQIWGFKIDDILDSGMFLQLGFNNSLFHITGQYAFANLDNDPKHLLAQAAYVGRVRGGADLYTLEAGVRFHDYEVPLALKLGYMGNTKDSYAVSLDNEGSFNKVGQIWFENNATGVSISTLPIEGQSMPGVLEGNSLSVFYASLNYDVLDNLNVGIEYVNGTNELKYLGTNRGDIDFQEITPVVRWQYNKNLTLSAYYAMLTTDRDKNVTPKSVNGGAELAATAPDSEDRNRLQLEVRYTF
ncbi:major outer membrane protein [Helicobacter sp.]|uniref:major outer membrane protein n=1 Tax=Helicobacter sp. TaxID=218 RepID=UPI0019B9F78B|nr:major outer membrane protein [Helicobacter sp.]MBD5164272.1 major outer membrane protein [Helicobacter sp.]